MMWQNLTPTVLTPWALPVQVLFFLPLLVWSFAWKGLALWRAAKRGEVYWFVALLVVNTVGILDILYLYVFGKGKGPGSEQV